MDLSTLASGLVSRIDFLALLKDHHRLLQVRTALPELALIPESLHGVDRVNAPLLDGFGYELDCLSTNAHFELKRLIGEQITVRLLQPSGEYRAIHGYVAQAAQLGGNGGLARYRLSLRSFGAFLARRQDSFLFQDLDTRQIIEAVLADHAMANWRWEASQALKTHSRCTQYQESDAAFITRMLASEGLSWHLEQLQGDAAAQADAKGHARHCLVIHDAASARTDLGRVRFAAQHVVATKGQDTLHQFHAAREFTALAVTEASWDYKPLAGTSAHAASSLNTGEVPQLEQYWGGGEYRFQDGAQAQARADQALLALELGLKRYQGQGGLRHLLAGAQFELFDHPHFGANSTALDYAGAALASHKRSDARFTLTEVGLTVRNNLGADMARLLQAPALESGSTLCTIEAVPAAAALTPPLPRKPTAPAGQLALVVGVDGEALSPDRDLRVKVQFPWQRGLRPNLGGLAHRSPVDETGNAPGELASGTWVRVAQAQAGANWGQAFTPRIGTEVAIGYLDGDIDRPVVTGQHYNAAHLPPWSAGEGSGANHPGVINGIRSQTLDGAGHNHWLVDDTPGQLRTRFASSHGQSELILGEGIAHNPLSSTRGAWRGIGAELGTQGWGSLRAPKGLYLTTQARAGSYGSAQGTQMDVPEALAQVRAATDLGQRLTQASTPGGAQALKTHEPKKAVDTWIEDTDPTKKGKHPSQLNGQEALQPKGGRKLEDPVPRPERPYLLLDSPSSLAHASPGDVVSVSGQSTTRISQGDQHETAAHTAVQVSGKHASLYAHEGELQVKAAAGPVSLHAHSDTLEILADQSVQILSVNDSIRIQAKDKIEIVAGDSTLVLRGGDIDFFTPGTFLIKSAIHDFKGGGSNPYRPKELPTGSADELEMGRLMAGLEDGASGGSGKAGSKTKRAQSPSVTERKPRPYSERVIAIHPHDGEAQTTGVAITHINTVLLKTSTSSGLSPRHIQADSVPAVAFVGPSGAWGVSMRTDEDSPLPPTEVEEDLGATEEAASEEFE
ncbi:type VI secretion system Vgr family protein [Inhella sp.]|uniref:type VI secretion system Vgr family protein n=1 Tax=Inhella sp. TaxID=1921806 RepID=UPI0035B2DFEB